jgi:hypothetical protein
MSWLVCKSCYIIGKLSDIECQLVCKSCYIIGKLTDIECQPFSVKNKMFRVYCIAYG